jgi:hypothetical protein
VNGARKMPVRPFRVLACVYEEKFFARVDAALHIGDVGLLDFLFCFVDQL